MKGSKTDPPDSLPDIAAARIHTWARAKYRGLTTLEIREFIEECLDWHVANAIQRSNWEATCRNWIRGGQRMKRERGRIRDQQRPQPKLSDSAPARVLALADRLGKGMK